MSTNSDLWASIQYQRYHENTTTIISYNNKSRPYHIRYWFSSCLECGLDLDDSQNTTVCTVCAILLNNYTLRVTRQRVPLNLIYHIWNRTGQSKKNPTASTPHKKYLNSSFPAVFSFCSLRSRKNIVSLLGVRLYLEQLVGVRAEDKCHIYDGLHHATWQWLPRCSLFDHVWPDSTKS